MKVSFTSSDTIMTKNEKDSFDNGLGATEQQGQVSVSPNKEERLKIDNYEEVIISSHK